MKKILCIVLTLASAAWCSATPLVRAVSMSGRKYVIPHPQGADNVFIFKDVNDPSFETFDLKSATWTELLTGKVYKGFTSFQNVTDGYCYSVEVDGKKETFVFIDYSKHRLTNATPKIDMGCSNTVISLEGLKEIQYFDSLNRPQILNYSLSVTYDNQQWAETDWQTVTKTDTLSVPYPGTITLDSVLCDTKFVIREDSISGILYGVADSLTIDTCKAVAVAHHQQYFITMRGKKLENEKEGPYEDQTIIHSAPLEVLFESHPSAKADVYQWTIRRGSDIKTTRTEKDIRYIFDEASESGPVTYMVDLKMTNSRHPDCVTTAQDTIILHSSMIMVPNVFTPNGDGKNDEFRVVFRSICDFHCWIYNRWQHLVYSWDDPTKGWDGTYNGRKEPDSAYFYIIEAKGCDGQDFKLKGSVNLLRGK